MKTIYTLTMTLFEGNTIKAETYSGKEPKNLVIIKKRNEELKDCKFDLLKIVADESYNVAVKDSTGHMVCMIPAVQEIVE